MSVVAPDATASVPSPRVSLPAPHVHAWELRAVEYDTWGQVSLYECDGCAGVRYA